MKSDQEKLKELIEGLEKLKSELGWLHWPQGSSTRSAIEDKIRFLLKKVKE